MNFWSKLMACVSAGDMEMHEAHKRHNLYTLARNSPCIENAQEYALEMDVEILPPVIFCGPKRYDECNEIWHEYVDSVTTGKIGPYEAAWAYYEAVNGD